MINCGKVREAFQSIIKYTAFYRQYFTILALYGNIIKKGMYKNGSPVIGTQMYGFCDIK